jgi:hypothetical protein
MAERKRLPQKQPAEVVVVSSLRPIANDPQETEETERLAHKYWLDRGSPIGTPEEDWFRAEKEIRLRRQPVDPGASRQ